MCALYQRRCIPYMSYHRMCVSVLCISVCVFCICRIIVCVLPSYVRMCTLYVSYHRVCRVGQHHIYTPYIIYDRVFGDLPANNTVYTPYTYDSDQPYVCAYVCSVPGMSQEASGLEAGSKYPQAEGSHARRMASLQADIKDIQDSIQELQSSER